MASLRPFCGSTRCRTKAHASTHVQVTSATERKRPGFGPVAVGLATLLQAAASKAEEAALYGGPVDSATYVPGPVEVGWQIYAGSAIAVFPFIIGSYEFGKRILIQQRCEVCDGIGLLEMKNGRYTKCKECGGFFPWLGWKTFFTSTASPGNGGPLLQPRGQTSVLYKVLPRKITSAPKADGQAGDQAKPVANSSEADTES